MASSQDRYYGRAFDPSAQDATGPVDGFDDLLASLPTTTDPIASLDMPSEEQGELVPVTARVPAAWLEQIDMIRQAVSSNMPDIWRTRSRWLRWAVYIAMRETAAISARVNSPDVQLDPILYARLHVERIGGDQAARASTMSETLEQLGRIGESLEMDVKIGEYEEAASRVEMWIASAYSQPSPYWQRFFIKAIGQVPSMYTSINTLIDSGHLPDPDPLLIETVAKAMQRPQVKTTEDLNNSL